MEKLVYLILSRDKDKFSILYVGDCNKTDEKSFFIQHPSFKCWAKHSESEKSLYLAILPLFDSSDMHRKNILNKILTHYKPPCNLDDIPQVKPDYVVRISKEKDSELKFTCPCCGSRMKSEQILERSTVFRCVNCGLSDTKIND